MSAMKWFIVTEEEIARLRRVQTRLYSEARLSGDDMRNLAQGIGAVIECAIPYDPSEGTVLSEGAPEKGHTK